MITTIAEHSVDLDLLGAKARILDIGCRGMLFANHMRHLRHEVTAIDVDLLPGEDYTHCGIAGYTGHCSIERNKDPQATKLVKRGRGEGRIPCYTLEEFSRNAGVELWDLIKIDIEGSEYEVLISLTKPPARQLSIEFHLHTGIYTMAEMETMEAQLVKLGYDFVSHHQSEQHCAGLNYWDSLFILN